MMLGIHEAGVSDEAVLTMLIMRLASRFGQTERVKTAYLNSSRKAYVGFEGALPAHRS